MDSYEVDKFENPEPVWHVCHRNSMLQSAVEDEEETTAANVCDDSAIGLELDEIQHVSDRGSVFIDRKTSQKSMSSKTSRGPRNPSGSSMVNNLFVSHLKGFCETLAHYIAKEYCFILVIWLVFLFLNYLFHITCKCLFIYCIASLF